MRVDMEDRMPPAQAPPANRLRLHGQPIVELRSGAIIRHELLLRVAQDGKDASPDRFLRGAQRPLIEAVDRWVAHRALRRARDGGGVHVNLSAHSIAGGFLEFVEKELGASGADPELVVFEMTEAQLLEDREASLGFVEGLRDLGFGFAMEDFGGHSGELRYLRTVPANYLKIDVRFVGDVKRDRASRRMAEAIVKLADGFGQRTIAEGVENLATLQLLEELGIDYAQGFALGHPEPLPD